MQSFHIYYTCHIITSDFKISLHTNCALQNVLSQYIGPESSFSIMGDMEYVPNPTFQMDTEQSSPTTATTITSPVQVEEESRPGQLTVQDKAGGSRRSDHSPSPRTPAVNIL